MRSRSSNSTTPASEKDAPARITEFEREFTSRTIASAVDAYIAAQERRVNEGELRTSTVEREGYHLRATLKLAEYGQLDLRKLSAKLAARLYDERAGAVDTHRNGLSPAITEAAYIDHGRAQAALRCAC